MNAVPVPLDGSSRLEPGSYFLEIAAPDAVLDAVSRNPDAARAVARFIVEQSGADVTFAGGGVAWSRASGELRRVYSMRFEVSETSAVPVLEAGFGRALLWALALAIGAGAGSYAAWTVYLYKFVPAADLPGVVEDVRDTARAASSAVGWLVFGGLAVGGYLIAKREGWLS